MTIVTEAELEKLRKIGRIVADTLVHMMQKTEIGMKTQELDSIGGAYLNKFNAQSAPKISYNFPGHTCISINNKIAHGIPSDKKIEAGDLVNIDVSAELDGYFADTGGTFIIPPKKTQYETLCKATAEAMYAGIASAKHREKISSIGKSIQNIAQKYNFSIIENLGSHGVGSSLHEEPKYIAPIFDPKDNRILKKGMVITVEPFLSNGGRIASESKDGWTLYINKKYRAAQFEHTIVITEGEPIILTEPSSDRFF